MALRLGKLYEALLEARISERVAREAAEEVAAYKLDIAGRRTQLRRVRMIWAIAGIVALLVAWQVTALSAALERLDDRLAALEQR